MVLACAARPNEAGITKCSTVPAATLPCEIASHVFELCPPLCFLKAAAATCRQFSFQWYVSRVFSGVVIVPDDVASLNEAMNKLAAGSCFGQEKGLLLVRPGIYQESVRVTQNCHILGLGRRDTVIVEAPGWESALVSAGLGGAAVPKMFAMQGLTTGEDACVENLRFRCRNEQMRGRCIYLVMGQLHLVRCTVEGGVKVSGHCTAPLLTECDIRGARGCGLHLTDHSKAVLRRNRVGRHGRHGVLADRGAKPAIVHNELVCNGAYGIRLFRGADCLPPVFGMSDAKQLRFASAELEELRHLSSICENRFDGNAAGELSLTPRYAESEASEEPEFYNGANPSC
eukprot:TRINITY_DN76732_c0_g1_i1.p1 TRINITY_DN76732_c0_g1~~TRINITY_DN76732_c0_g1_i1.p1  ORF type:complete len:350 (-),score=48.17 TRINITY_DN76732_c0_g1_i1:34-1062(-)